MISDFGFRIAEFKALQSAVRNPQSSIELWLFI